MQEAPCKTIPHPFDLSALKEKTFQQAIQPFLTTSAQIQWLKWLKWRCFIFFDSEPAPFQGFTCSLLWYLVGFSLTLITYWIILEDKHSDFVSGWVNPLWSWLQLLTLNITPWVHLALQDISSEFTFNWCPVTLARSFLLLERWHVITALLQQSHSSLTALLEMQSRCFGQSHVGMSSHCDLRYTHYLL